MRQGMSGGVEGGLHGLEKRWKRDNDRQRETDLFLRLDKKQGDGVRPSDHHLHLKQDVMGVEKMRRKNGG